MAWDFAKSDFVWLGQVSLVHPDPKNFWWYVRNNSSDPDVVLLAQSISFGMQPGTLSAWAGLESIRVQLQRVGDNETEVEIIDTAEDQAGATRTYQVKTRGIL